MDFRGKTRAGVVCCSENLSVDTPPKKTLVLEGVALAITWLKVVSAYSQFLR